MRLSPDQLIFWRHGFLQAQRHHRVHVGPDARATVGSKLVTRKLSTDLKRARWQNVLEIVVLAIQKQIADVGLEHPEKYIGFLGTLFLFIATASVFTVIPGYEPPTASLSTTVALALCVFVAVPLFGIKEQGLEGYLKSYVRADGHHAAVQHHQRNLADAGPGCAPLRQHDERRDDHRHPAYDNPLHFSDRHDDARSAHRHGAGLHLQHLGRGLHRRRDSHSPSQTQACTRGLKPR